MEFYVTEKFERFLWLEYCKFELGVNGVDINVG